MTRKVKTLWKNTRRHEPLELDSVQLWQEFDEESNKLIDQYVVFSSLWETIDADYSDAIEIAKTILDRIGKEQEEDA